MASYVFKLEETDDDYILVNLEEEKEEDACSESIQQLEDALVLDSQSDDEESFDMASDQSPEHVDVSGKQLKQRMELSIEDVVKQHALVFLPAKSLYKCRAVSKDWEQWIGNPFFIHQHTLHFKDVSGLFCQLPGEDPSFISLDPSAFGVRNPTLNFLPEHVDVRATCNGLLCCQGRSENQAYYICNPVTEEWKMLPDPLLYHAAGTGIALAFEPSTFNFDSHYQLIAMVQSLDCLIRYFEIYSSETNSWRISETVCCETDIGETNGDGFYMRGYAYWEMQSGVALAFNVIEEQYGIVSLPPCNAPIGALTQMDGGLCYVFPRQDNEIEVYSTMEMRLKYVIRISPNAVMDLGWDRSSRAVCFVNDDMLILEVGEKIIAYHVSKRKSQRLSHASIEGFSKYLPYVNSLVPVAT
ncbi:F-box protein At5g49610-like [Euphorbia lathyris]|uniref:F-box protein At5g49610-like n=1 Tax=Euphorbia lathyris TaxID=212925 RepID=UPI0033144769